MAADNFNSVIPNNEIGLTFTRSRRVVVDTSFGEMATWIKLSLSGTPGVVVWYNEETGEYGVWDLDIGELFPVACTKIVTSATIDGSLETTTAVGMFWGTNSPRIGKK